MEINGLISINQFYYPVQYSVSKRRKIKTTIYYQCFIPRRVFPMLAHLPYHSNSHLLIFLLYNPEQFP